jgi:type II secretory pathway pseudopilin PulG
MEYRRAPVLWGAFAPRLAPVFSLAPLSPLPNRPKSSSSARNPRTKTGTPYSEIGGRGLAWICRSFIQVDWIKCITNRLPRAARREAGITLIETVFAIAIFGVVSTSVIGVLTSATAADGFARQKTIALQLAQQQIEYVRQLNYANVCIVGGNPSCPSGTTGIPPTQEKWVMGLRYTLTTRVKWVNDPVSGGFSTNANYKQVRVIVSRARDGTELSRIATYVSSATRDSLGGINNAVINVRAVDFGIADHPLLGDVAINLSDSSTGFNANDTTDSATGSTTFGTVTFAAVEPTTSDYYNIVASHPPNYRTLKEDLPTAPGASTHLQIAPSATETRTVNLYKPCSIYVHVIDESTGLPYLGTAYVTIYSSRGSQTFTTTNGYVQVVAPGDTLAGELIVPLDGGYSITVDTPNHRHGELMHQTVPEDYANNILSSSFDVTLGTVPVPQNATLTVIVRHTRSDHTACTSGSLPPPEASVTITDPSQSPPNHTPTSTDGEQWVFADIPLGTYDIAVSYRDGWRTRRGSLPDVPLTEDTTVCVPVIY